MIFSHFPHFGISRLLRKCKICYVFFWWYRLICRQKTFSPTFLFKRWMIHFSFILFRTDIKITQPFKAKKKKIRDVFKIENFTWNFTSHCQNVYWLILIWREKWKILLNAMSGNRTRVNCLEGSYALHYTNIAWVMFYSKRRFVS